MRAADDFVAEVERMADGRRTIIYYSWPDSGDADHPTADSSAGSASATPAPPQEPWSPETQPDATSPERAG